MRRRVATLFALAWIAALLTADWWFIREFKVAEAHVKTALAGIFAAPVSFGGLSLGPTFVKVSDLRLMRPDNPNKLYGTIDEVRVTPRWSKLLTGLELEVEEIAVQNPTLVVRWNPADRTFDMPSPLREALEPKATTAELPAITLKGLTLALENPPDIVKQRQNFLFKDLSIGLTPEGSKSWLYRFEVDANHPILGTMRGFGRFRKDAFEIEVRRNGLMVTPALLGVVNADVKKFLEQISVAGDLTVTASVGPVNGGTAEAFSATVECQGMSAQVKDWPQALTNVRGRIEYSQGRLSTEGLAGEFEGAPLIVRGAIDLSGGRKVVDASGEIVRLGITNDLAARIRKLPDPCPTIADQIEAWDPDGYANVKFSLTKERDETQKPGPLTPFISVEFSGGSKIRYIGHIGDDGRRHGFAYPLLDLRGTIKFTDKVASFDRLTAMNGSLAVEAHGTIDYERGGDETYDVDVDARGMMLDERVSRALEGASRELFNSLVADGSADLAVAIKRKKGEEPGPRVDITVDLGGVSLWPQQFPVDLADARGRLVITDAGPVKIEKVTARRQGGVLSISGIVPVSRGPTQLSLDISVDKFQIDGAVTSALAQLAPGVAGTLTKLNPVGRIDGTLHVGALPDGSISDIRGAIRFDDVTLAPEDPSVRIENVGGSIAILPTMVKINEGTTGQIAGERFAVRGTVKTAPEDAVLDLTVEAENFQVDRELLADLEPMIPWLHKSEKKPELAGQMSVVLHATGPVTKPEYHAELDFHGVDIVPGALPGVPLDAVQGHLTVTPAGVVTLRDFSTRIRIPRQAVATSEAPGGGTGAESASRPSILVTLADGRFDPAGGTPIKPVPERLSLNGCSVVGLELTPSVLAMIPVGADLGATIAKLGLTGAVDLVFPNVKWDGIELRAAKGQLLASRVAIGNERKLTADFFQIDKLTLKAGGGLFDLGGQFFLRGARVFDFPVPACNGRIAADMSGLRFESLDADLLGYDQDKKGQRFALGKINPEESRLEFQFDQGTFEANLRLQEVNLPATFRALGGNPGQVSGTYRVALDLGGVLSDTATYRGKGDLSIRARNVVSLPVFYKMFNSLDVLTFFQRTDPWTKVEVAFEVKDSAIRMEKIRIDSPDVLLEGPGTLTFAGMVKANLRANGGLGISPIGWVTRLISKAVFAGVTIDGPVGDPKVDAYSAAGR